MGIVITGRAYGRRATLDVAGDTLTWRAQRGRMEPVRENIATTTHDLRDVSWVVRRLSRGGTLGAVLSLVWMGIDSVTVGLGLLVLSLAWIVYRAIRPARLLGLDLGERWLVLHVDAASTDDAGRLASRVRTCLLTGEVAAAPPTLP